MANKAKQQRATTNNAGLSLVPRVAGAKGKTYRVIKREDHPVIMGRFMGLEEVDRQIAETQRKLKQLNATKQWGQEALEALLERRYAIDSTLGSWVFHTDGPDGPFFLLQGTPPPPAVAKWLHEHEPSATVPAPPEADVPTTTPDPEDGDGVSAS